MPRDVSMQWNSTFNMLRFAIEYRLAIDTITEECSMKLCDYKCHRWVRRDTSSVKVFACKTVTRLPLVGFFGVQKLTERVVRLRAGWLSLGHPMS